MNRTNLLVIGALSWSIVAVDAALHLSSGDLFVPVGMIAVFALYVGLRQSQRRLRPVRAD